MNRLRFLLLVGILGCGSSTAPPSGPALAISFSQATVSQGNTVSFTITLPSAALPGGMPLIFTFSGIATGSDTTVVPTDTSGAPLQGTLTIPSGSPDGVLNLAVALPQLGQHASAALTIKDTEMPTVGVNDVDAAIGSFTWFASPMYGQPVVFIAGAVDTISIAATDNHQLAWVGWSLTSTGTISDSIAASGVSGTATFAMRVPAAFAASGATLTAFATDADGNRATSVQSNVTIANLTTHPSQSVPRGARINDVAFDSARGLVYLAKPDSLTVSVLALGSMSYQSGITFTTRPTSVDLTPGGDSLIVGLGSPPAIAIVDLTSASHPVLSTTPITVAATTDTISALRVSADDRAIAYASNSTQQQTVVVELNLTTGTQTAVVTAGANYCAVRPTRSGDRSHVMLMNCPSASTIYLSGTHTYAPGVYNSDGGGGENMFTSASASAPYEYQWEHVTVDSTMAQLISGDAGYNSYGAAIAPNGTDFYAADGECSGGCAETLPGIYFHYVRSQAQPQEFIIAPHPAYEFAVTPDGGTLLGLTADTIVAMDLAHSTPATASMIARFKRLMRRPPHAPVHVPHVDTTPNFVIRLTGRPPRSLHLTMP
jgi:hypothetical protein